MSLVHPIHPLEDMGIMRLDRPFSSCKHCTTFCVKGCYARRLAKFYKKVPGSLERSGKYFDETKGKDIAGDIGCMMRLNRNGVRHDRFRWCAMGEPFDTIESVKKIDAIAKELPGINFWIPTRAWRNGELKKIIERTIMKRGNCFVQASIDPSNSKEELRTITKWRTMFFGDNDKHPVSSTAFKCPKTFDKGGGVTCKNCEGGCFNKTTQHVHLKKH
jgi:hypothetical protein